MADFFAKGNKPISAYGSPNHGLVELWKNSDITSAFAGQTIKIENFDVTKIDAVGLGIAPSTNESKGYEIKWFDKEVLVGARTVSVQTMNLYPNVSKVDKCEREVSFLISGSDLNITFGNCAQSLQNAIGSASTVSQNVNTACIPVRILGLLHED